MQEQRMLNRINCCHYRWLLCRM
ncbi:hypothetical protein Gogos_011923 [Gossypium gossypioides]|uniref:Uncharacterized protein n=1 Tax=Gossypium gossypioides TaxID=34282 RepID=A0A7J9BQW6_GOSGO|nr:hypothetical protein [Gossypium gossypioides]